MPRLLDSGVELGGTEKLSECCLVWQRVGMAGRTPLERVLAWVAVLVPFAFAVSRSTGADQWRGDISALRDHGLVSVAFGGSLTTAATQALDLLPLGSLAFRATLAAAVALAVGCHCCFRAVRRVLLAKDMAPSLTALIATLAALTVGLSATWQSEATVGGGAICAVALALVALDHVLALAAPGATTLTPDGGRRWLMVAVLLGALLAENIPAGVACLVATAAALVTAGRAPSKRLVGPMVVGGGLSFSLLAALPLLRRVAPRNFSDLSRSLSSSSLAPMQLDATRTAALEAWLSELGMLALALATIGVLVNIFRDRARAMMTALVVLVLADLVYPLAAVPRMGPDPLGALRALALGSLGVASALGLAEVVLFLRKLNVPMARTASVLTVVFYMTVVAVTCEEAAFAAGRADMYATEEWTDAALVELPADAAVIVHSPELSFRLWAARVVRGQRPDTIVIAAPLLQGGNAVANLLPTEPDAAPLARDFALVGSADEYAMSALADKRPVFVELDRVWDERLVKHLTVEGAWLRYASQALGRSDRKTMRAHIFSQGGRVVSALSGAHMHDAATAQIVGRTLKEHATVLSLIGMTQAARPLLADIEQLERDDPFAFGARLRLAHAARRRPAKRPVELRDLLAFRY